MFQLRCDVIFHLEAPSYTACAHYFDNTTNFIHEFCYIICININQLIDLAVNALPGRLGWPVSIGFRINVYPLLVRRIRRGSLGGVPGPYIVFFFFCNCLRLWVVESGSVTDGIHLKKLWKKIITSIPLRLYTTGLSELIRAGDLSSIQIQKLW